MSFKDLFQWGQRNRLMIISDEYIDVSGNFNNAILNVPHNIDYVFLKKSFEKPGLSWRNCWLNWSRR